MPNQMSKDKQRQTFVLPKELVARLAGRAAEEKTTKTAIVQAALEEYLKPTEPPATRADLTALAQKLDEMERGRKEAEEAAQKRVERLGETLAKAIQEQPMTVQALPQADEQDWRDKSLWARIMKR